MNIISSVYKHVAPSLRPTKDWGGAHMPFFAWHCPECGETFNKPNTCKCMCCEAEHPLALECTTCHTINAPLNEQCVGCEATLQWKCAREGCGQSNDNLKADNEGGPNLQLRCHSWRVVRNAEGHHVRLYCHEPRPGSWAHAKRLREAEAHEGTDGGALNPAAFANWGAYPPLEPFPNTFRIGEKLHATELRRTRGDGLMSVQKLERVVHRLAEFFVYRVQELNKVSTRNHRTDKQGLLKAVDKARRCLKGNVEYVQYCAAILIFYVNSPFFFSNNICCLIYVPFFLLSSSGTRRYWRRSFASS